MAAVQSCSRSLEGKSPKESISTTITDAPSSCSGSCLFHSTLFYPFSKWVGLRVPYQYTESRILRVCETLFSGGSFSLSDGPYIGPSGISSRYISNQRVGILGFRRDADCGTMCRTSTARKDRLGTDDFR